MRNLPLITIPHPFKYGFSFSFHQFLVVGTIYLLSGWKQSAISPPRQWFPADPFREKSISPD